MYRLYINRYHQQIEGNLLTGCAKRNRMSTCLSKLKMPQLPVYIYSSSASTNDCLSTVISASISHLWVLYLLFSCTLCTYQSRLQQLQRKATRPGGFTWKCQTFLAKSVSTRPPLCCTKFTIINVRTLRTTALSATTGIGWLVVSFGQSVKYNSPSRTLWSRGRPARSLVAVRPCCLATGVRSSSQVKSLHRRQ